MTVSTSTSFVSYAGNGSLTTFAYTFKIFQDSDLLVTLVNDASGAETTQVLTTNYTVTGAGTASGGNVTFTTAPASGTTVKIRRVLPVTQETDYVANDPFPAEAHEDALDKLTMLVQQEAANSDLAISFPEGDVGSGLNNVVPSAVERADKLLSFDTEGNVQTQAASDLLTGSVLGANYTKASYTGNGATTAYSTVNAAGSKNNIQVYIDGVYQNKDTFSISGSTLTFTEAPPLNSAIEFIVGNAVTSLTTDPDVVTYNQGGTGAQDRTLTSRLQDYVSVRDFGADNTGVTDCTAIVQSLIDAAQAGTGPRAIFFPAGEYYFEPQSSLINTCLQFAESDPTYQSQPEPIRIYGEGANSRIVVNNTGANNVWMAGPQGTASECVSAVFVEKLNFCSKSAAASGASDRTTYANNYLTMPNYARIFNVGRMWRCEFRDLFFEYCKGFFTENSGEDSNNSFAQQIIVDRCHSTAHQDRFIDLNQAWSCTFSNNTMESGNGCIKIGRSNAQSSYGVRIVNNTMQGNGGTYCGLRINYGSSIYIVGNYFESNRASSSSATPNIYMNNNTTESSIVIDGNFFAQSAANLDGYGADYYHVTLDEVRNTVVFRGNTFSGGNGYLCSNTSDGYLISLSDKFETIGTTYNEGIVASNITFSDTIPIYKPATTWTPVIADASSGGNTATGTINNPRYVRTGDLVTISAQILNIDTTGLTSGNILYIRGLPISSSAQGLSQGSCVLEQVTFSGFVVPQVPDSSDYIVLRQSQSAGNDLSLTVGALSSGTADIQFTVTYRV